MAAVCSILQFYFSLKSETDILFSWTKVKIFPKWVYLVIFGIKVQPNKAHSMTQVMMTLTEYQGQNFPKMGKILNNWPAISRMLFHLQTSYLVQPNNLQRSRSNFPKKGKMIKELAISWMLFKPQTSSHLLSQVFVAHLGVSLLFSFWFDTWISS